MTLKEIDLVKSSWTFIVLNKAEAGNLFYSRLFEIAPEVRPMFATDVTEQARNLVSIVTVIVTKLDKLGDIIEEVRALAKRHVKYGATPQQFQPVGEALLWTLEKGLGDRWTPELEKAWIEVYTILSNAMIEAMTEAA